MHAVEAGVLERGDVTQLGNVLAGNADGRQSDEEITVFDSTRLAIQDLSAEHDAGVDDRVLGVGRAMDEAPLPQRLAVVDLRFPNGHTDVGNRRAGSNRRSSESSRPRIAFATICPHMKPMTLP